MAREKVLSKTKSDFGETPTLVAFSSTGKMLCVAGKEGLLCVLNIESGVITNAIPVEVT